MLCITSSLKNRRKLTALQAAADCSAPVNNTEHVLQQTNINAPGISSKMYQHEVFCLHILRV